MALDRFRYRGFAGCCQASRLCFVSVGALPGRCFVHLRNVTYFPITSLSDESDMM